jgi:hypothetical protein
VGVGEGGSRCILVRILTFVIAPRKATKTPSRSLTIPPIIKILSVALAILELQDSFKIIYGSKSEREGTSLHHRVQIVDWCALLSCL